MALTLSIETATVVCSVALHQEGRLLALQELHLKQSHSGYLTVLIKDIVHYAGCSMQDITMVALSKGPGSYTGLRIGTATAKGLCYALDIPLVAVNSLEAMAYGVAQYNMGENFLCPMIDARRMEVYCLVADWQSKTIMPTSPVVIEPTSFERFLRERPVLFFGDGSAKCKSILIHDNAKFIDNITPSAKDVGALVDEKTKRGEITYEDVAYFEPFYLKEFKAKQALAK